MKLLVFLAFVLAGLSGPLAAVTASPPQPGGAVLVILARGEDPDDLLRRADGTLLGPTRAPFAVLATSPGSDFAERLVAEGAIAVTDGALMARICGVR